MPNISLKITRSSAGPRLDFGRTAIGFQPDYDRISVSTGGAEVTSAMTTIYIHRGEGKDADRAQ